MVQPYAAGPATLAGSRVNAAEVDDAKSCAKMAMAAGQTFNLDGRPGIIQGDQERANESARSILLGRFSAY
jgi:hypothetical protein